MIKTGDKVRFLNDVGGGKVTSFINKNMVNVMGDDGFEIPHPISQLVVVGSSVKDSADASAKKKSETIKKAEPVEIKIIKGKENPDFYFCFVPENNLNPVNGNIGLYLINDSNFYLLYHYSHLRSSGYITKKYGLVNPNSKKILEKITENDFGDLPEFGFQILWFMAKGQFTCEPVSRKFKINPLKLYKETTFQNNSFFENKALVFQITKNIQDVEIEKLTQDDLRKIVKEKEQETEKIPIQKTISKTIETVEIDLHIHELLESTLGLTNGEMLEIQLKKVETEMNTAIQKGVKRIVFIHGVGQGVLKQEITKLLQSKFGKFYFQDASFREYGYGATMVILKRG